MGKLTSNEPLSIEVYLAGELAESNRLAKKYFDEKFEDLHEVMTSGFPDGNPVLHRKWHEDDKASEESRKKFITTLITTILGSTGATLLGSLIVKYLAG